ncbi:MAG: diguanylate cyclase [Magnetococcus sp. XQGC-1]
MAERMDHAVTGKKEIPRRYWLPFWVGLLGVIITVLTALSLRHSSNEEAEQTMTLAINTARANFSKDLSLRQWATRHGGVYVPVDERTPPNPNLSHIPERDIATPSGKHLTLMNPAYMLRQVMEEYSDLYGTRGKITSLKPLNPANAPDSWEEKALHALDAGAEEVMEVVGEGLDASLRLLRPMVTQGGCLKCHAFQGYKVGDVRGGIGVQVPLRSFREAEAVAVRNLMKVHGFAWVVGMFLLGCYYWVARARLQEQIAAEENEARMRAMTKSLQDAIVVFDEGGMIQFCNRVCADMFGRQEDALLTCSIDTLFSAPWLGSNWQATLLAGQQTRQTHAPHPPLKGTARHGDGREFPVDIAVSRWQRHGATFYTAIIRDTTELKILEARDLRAYVNRIAISALLEIGNEALSLDRKLEVALEIILTVPWLAMQYKGSIFLTSGHNRLKMVAQKNLHPQLLQKCHQLPYGFCLCGRAAAEKQIVFSDALDARHDVRFNGISEHGHYCVPILLQDQLLGVLNLYVDHGHPYDPEEEAFLTTIANTLSGVIDRGLAEERLQHMASHDTLTGLPNRTLFQELLDQELRRAARYDQLLAVGFIDLDHFKVVNDTLGHDVGDLLLQEVALRTRQQLRDSDVLARLGGDEFTLILPTIGDQETAIAVGKKIVQALSEPFVIQGQSCQIGASVGLSLFPEHGQSADILLQMADKTMYAIKRGGRNGVAVWRAV